MTDPGDLSNTDSNVRSDLPDAAPENINTGKGEDGHDAKIRQNERDQARVMEQGSDLIDPYGR